jgi:hypothetical protein
MKQCAPETGLATLAYRARQIGLRCGATTVGPSTVNWMGSLALTGAASAVWGLKLMRQVPLANSAIAMWLAHPSQRRVRGTGHAY